MHPRGHPHDYDPTPRARGAAARRNSQLPEIAVVSTSTPADPPQSSGFEIFFLFHDCISRPLSYPASFESRSRLRRRSAQTAVGDLVGALSRSPTFS